MEKIISMKNDKIYIVTAHRWGDNHNHSYTVGASTKKAKAIDIADEETNYRGGKYGCVVEQVYNGFYDQFKEPKEIYRTKSLQEL